MGAAGAAHARTLVDADPARSLAETILALAAAGRES
jgi:hypothetical protein